MASIIVTQWANKSLKKDLKSRLNIVCTFCEDEKIFSKCLREVKLNIDIKPSLIHFNIILYYLKAFKIKWHNNLYIVDSYAIFTYRFSFDNNIIVICKQIIFLLLNCKFRFIIFILFVCLLNIDLTHLGSETSRSFSFTLTIL